MYRAATLRAVLLLNCSILIAAATAPTLVVEPELVAPTYGRMRPIASIAFSPDGKILGPAKLDGAIKLIWTVPSGK